MGCRDQNAFLEQSLPRFEGTFVTRTFDVPEQNTFYARSIVRSRECRPQSHNQDHTCNHNNVVAFPFDSVLPYANDETENESQQPASRISQYDAQRHEHQLNAPESFLNASCAEHERQTQRKADGNVDSEVVGVLQNTLLNAFKPTIP